MLQVSKVLHGHDSCVYTVYTAVYTVHTHSCTVAVRNALENIFIFIYYSVPGNWFIILNLSIFQNVSIILKVMNIFNWTVAPPYIDFAWEPHDLALDLKSLPGLIYI